MASIAFDAHSLTEREDWDVIFHDIAAAIEAAGLPDIYGDDWKIFDAGVQYRGSQEMCHRIHAILVEFPVEIYLERETVRFFRGASTRQVDGHTGKPALKTKWYYEPEDYEGDVLFSSPFDTYQKVRIAARAARWLHTSTLQKEQMTTQARRIAV